jgi:hypothetical protein
MERQVFWWRRPTLPEMDDLRRFEELDGILIDAPVPPAQILGWQNRLGRQAAAGHHISFADARLQRQWLVLAYPGEYVASVMSWDA